MRFGASVHIDASATLAITHRRGLGKLRHIEVHWLWIQEKVGQGVITIKEINGKENPADLFTKHLPIEEVRNILNA